MMFSTYFKILILGFSIFISPSLSSSENEWARVFAFDTKELDVEYDYNSKDRVVRIKYDPRGWGNSKQWSYSVRNYEEAQFAFADLTRLLDHEKTHKIIKERILNEIDSYKFNNMAECRVVHLPVRPIESSQFEQFLGLVDQLTSRTLSSVQENIHSTQKMFNLVTANGEEYEVLVALDLNSRIQALSIAKDGNSLQSQYIEMSEDGVRINNEDGEELFSYEFTLDTDSESGYDEIYLNLYNKQSRIGVSENEKFRIHTVDGKYYQAYRYNILEDIHSESIIRFDRSRSSDLRIQNLALSLNLELDLGLSVPEEISNCIEPLNCSLSILLDQGFEKTVAISQLSIDEKDSLNRDFQSCLLMKEVLQKGQVSQSFKVNDQLEASVSFCLHRLRFQMDEFNFHSFLSSRYLSLPGDSILIENLNRCKSVRELDQVRSCMESINIIQAGLANTQPTFHLNYLSEVEDCLSGISSFDVFLREVSTCVEARSSKFQKVVEIDSILNQLDKFPNFISSQISSQSVSTFLNSCESNECFKDFIYEQYQTKILPNLFEDYPVDDELKQVLTNRILRKLRRIHREDLSVINYTEELKVFEQDILNELMSKSMDNLAEDLIKQRIPELYSANEEGRLERASETFDYENEREQIVSEFLSHMHIDLIGSNDQSIGSQIDLAVQERGIKGGKIVLNQLVKDFYLWSSEKRSEDLLASNNLYEGNELGYRMEDITEEVEECFEGYSPTSQERSVQSQIVRCEIKRIKAATYYKTKKAIEKEISKYFDLQSIKANELMGINQFLRRCLRNKEKQSKTIEEYELASMQCVTLAYVDTKQNIYKYQAIDANFTKLAGDSSEIYSDSVSCLKQSFFTNPKVENLNNEQNDSLERIFDYSFSAPTTLRFLSSIYSDVAYETVENHEDYLKGINEYLEQMNKEELSGFLQNLEEGCFAQFEEDRIMAVREGIVKAAGLDTLNLTTNLNESAKEVFADAIDLELVKMLLSDDYLLDEEFFDLTMAGASPDVQYVNKKMTVDFLINTVNGISNLLKEGFYNDPNEAKTALVTFSSRLKELIQLAEANNRPFHIQDLMGILRQHRLFDTLAIGYLSQHMRRTISSGLLEFRDEQIKQNNLRHPEVKELMEGEIRSEHISMRSAIYRSLRTDQTFRTAGIYSSSSSSEGREISNLIKEKIILPQLLGGEPTVNTLDELNSKIVRFFDNRQKSAIFFGEAAKQFRNNIYPMARERQWGGSGTSAYLRLHSNRDDFLRNYYSSSKRTQFIQKITDGIFIEPFRKSNSHFKDILSEEWQRGSIETYDLMSDIGD